jgi:hypothetical protein
LKKNSLVVQFAARGGGTPSAATLATINASESKPKVAVKKEEDSGDGLFGGDGDVKKEDNVCEFAEVMSGYLTLKYRVLKARMTRWSSSWSTPMTRKIWKTKKWKMRMPSRAKYADP